MSSGDDIKASHFALRIDDARKAGIDIGQVVESWATHLLADRDKHRENPRLAEKANERLCVTVVQRSSATGVRWESIGGLPEGIQEIRVSANTLEAARNRLTVPQLLEQRFRRQLTQELQRIGLYQTDLEGRRSALQRALDASISIADIDLAAS